MGRRTHLLIGIIYLLLGGALVATSFGWNPFGTWFGGDGEEPAPAKDQPSRSIPIDQLPRRRPRLRPRLRLGPRPPPRPPRLRLRLRLRLRGPEPGPGGRAEVGSAGSARSEDLEPAAVLGLLADVLEHVRVGHDHLAELSGGQAQREALAARRPRRS